MPIVITGDRTGQQQPMYTQGLRIDYDYPHDKSFAPHTRRHNEIVTRLMQIAEESWSVMQQRHDQWREIDHMMTAFIRTSDYEEALKERGGDRDQFHGKNRPVSVVVPYSYATHETIMTYITQAFFGAPLFQYSHTSPEDVVAAKLLELAVDAQARRFKASLPLHASISDALKYGIGATTFEWREVWGKRSVIEEVDTYDDDGTFMGSQREKRDEDALLFEGSKLSNIDPYRFLPDPNVSAHEFQEGQYMGWVSLDTYQDMLEEEAANEDVFNVKYLGQDVELRQRFSRFTPDLSGRERKHTGSDTGAGIKTIHTDYVTNVHMFVKLIPKEWDLPGDPERNRDGELPEKWLFTIANDTLLVRASRHNLNHNMYPVSVAAPDYDGYSATPVSRMELLHGLQEGMNWLYNSHIANVRKAMNDMLIVDPSLVVMKDLQNPEPGKLVRLRRRAWGHGVKDVVQQLAVNDVTRQNIPDSLYIMDVMQRVSAAVDAVQGIVRGGGERRSATEYRTTVNNAMSRLEHIARLVSLQYIYDLSYMMASHTQQFMSVPVFAQIVGEWPEVLNSIFDRDKGVVVEPTDILVDYDVIVKDGSIPTAGVGNADLYVQLFQIITQQPHLMQQFDVVRLFTRIATMLGDKNAWDFIQKGGQVGAVAAGEEEVMNQVQKGNLVSLNQAA